MRKVLSLLTISVLIATQAFGAGITKREASSTDAGSGVIYGSPDTGNTIHRVRTDSLGRLLANISGTYTGALSISQNSDTVEISHDGTDALMKWSDGNLILQTDEGTNTPTYVYAKGKGTGAGVLQAEEGNTGTNKYWQTGVGTVTSGVVSTVFGASTTEWAINDGSRDVNFRVESDNYTNAFFVDAGTGDVTGHLSAISNQHNEIGVYLDLLTAPKAIWGITGTGATTTTEAGYESGAGRTWTYSGGLATDKIFKGQTYVYSFNGTDSYLSTPDTDDMSFGDGSNDSAFSVGGWIEVVNTAGNQRIIGKITGSAVSGEWALSLGSTEVLNLLTWDTSESIATLRATDSALSVGWHFVVAVYNSTGGATNHNNTIIYVDGVAVASTPTNNAGYVAMQNMNVLPNIGRDTAGSGYFAGDMGRLFVTAEALSAATIWKMYEKTRGFYNV